jgi:hypothetical protein
MKPKFRLLDMVTFGGHDEIGTVADVLHAPGTEPLYSIRIGNELKWAMDNELDLFFSGFVR